MRHAGDLYPVASTKQLHDCLCGIKGLFYRRDAHQNNVTWYAGKPPDDEKDTNVDMPKPGDQTVGHRTSNVPRTRNNQNVRSYGPVHQNNNCSASTKNTSKGRLSTKSNNTSFR